MKELTSSLLALRELFSSTGKSLHKLIDEIYYLLNHEGQYMSGYVPVCLTVGIQILVNKLVQDLDSMHWLLVVNCQGDELRDSRSIILQNTI